jgi:hypothetical protein
VSTITCALWYRYPDQLPSKRIQEKKVEYRPLPSGLGQNASRDDTIATLSSPHLLPFCHYPARITTVANTMTIATSSVLLTPASTEHGPRKQVASNPKRHAPRSHLLTARRSRSSRTRRPPLGRQLGWLLIRARAFTRSRSGTGRR